MLFLTEPLSPTTQSDRVKSIPEVGPWAKLEKDSNISPINPLIFTDGPKVRNLALISDHSQSRPQILYSLVHSSLKKMAVQIRSLPLKNQPSKLVKLLIIQPRLSGPGRLVHYESIAVKAENHWRDGLKWRCSANCYFF